MIYINEKLRFQELDLYSTSKYNWTLVESHHSIFYRNAFNTTHFKGVNYRPKTIISFNVLKYMT